MDFYVLTYALLEINEMKLPNMSPFYIHNILFSRGKTVSIRKDLHHHQQVQRNHLARHHPRRVLRRRRFRTQIGPIRRLHRPLKLVGPDLGPNRLQLRQDRVRVVPDRRLRLDHQVRGRGKHPRLTCRIYPRVPRFLRRQPR